MSKLRPATLCVVPALFGLLAVSPPQAAAQRTTVFGTVYDSLNGRPLAGANVQLASSDLQGGVRAARTDSQGRFQLDRVPAGDYVVGFTHPFLDSLGLEVPLRSLTVEERMAQIQFALAIPGTLSIRSQLCPETPRADSSGLMLGFLREADANVRVDSGMVLLEWTEMVVDRGEIHAVRKSATAHATGAGWYAVCGLSTAGPIAAHAVSGSNESGYIDVRVPPRGMLHRDFNIPTGNAAMLVATGDSGEFADSAGLRPARIRGGNSTISGLVRNEAGDALSGAQVMVWGSGNTTTTRDNGRFAITGLPAGTQTVEVRYVGFAPKRAIVDLASGRSVSTTITMSERADVLDGMIVYGVDRQLANDLEGFNQRRKLGFGHFITRTDIERQSPIRFTDLFRSSPGLRIVSTGGLDYSLVASHGSSSGGVCRPLIFINGVRLANSEGLDMMVDPHEVAGVEIYNGVGETPPQFKGGLNGECGTVAIWTVPNLPLTGSRP